MQLCMAQDFMWLIVCFPRHVFLALALLELGEFNKSEQVISVALVGFDSGVNESTRHIARPSS